MDEADSLLVSVGLAIVAVFLAALTVRAVVFHARGIEARRGGIGVVGMRTLSVGVSRSILVRMGLSTLALLPLAAAAGRQTEDEQGSENERKRALEHAFHSAGKVGVIECT